VLTLYRAPYSTNVERVALAIAHKGLAVESVVIDYRDRSEVLRVSGQPLVPVLLDGDRVVSDSRRILAHLEGHHPRPPLFPPERARRTEMELFMDWFERVWKPAPNRIEAELGRAEPDHARIAEPAATMQGHLDHFAHLLDGRRYLWGDELSAADCVAYPFVKYAAGREPADDELFHRILDRHQTLEPRHGAVARWIERVGALPRA
jgi:maleylacetoacetate isomerase